MQQHREFIEGYHLKYRADSGTNGFTMQTVLGSTNKIITGLTPGSGYMITVQPFNSRFSGPESDPVQIITLGQGRTVRFLHVVCTLAKKVKYQQIDGVSVPLTVGNGFNSPLSDFMSANKTENVYLDLPFCLATWLVRV